MSYFAARPASGLREIAASYYQTEATAGDITGASLSMRALFLPSASAKMIFCYNDSLISFKDKRTSTRTVCNIIGPHDFHAHCLADGFPRAIRTLNVKFQPGGFYKLFGIESTEMRNACFSAGDVLGKEGRLIEDRLNNSSSIEERVRILDDFFLEKLHSADPGKSSRTLKRNSYGMCEALDKIGRQNGRIKVSGVAVELGIPRRTLEWQFSHHVGLSVKEFARITRFNSILNDVLHRGPVNWAEVAASHGYHDQTHMIKEFKAATTLTPYSFMKLRGKTFFKSLAILNFIDPACRQHPFIEHWIEVSDGMEEHFKSFLESQRGAPRL